MKSSIGFLLLLIAVAHANEGIANFAINNPTALFTAALDYQQRTTLLQQDIVDTITALRGQLSSVLKVSANRTLSSIESNIETIFEMDFAVRTLLFVQNNQTTSCLTNLRTQLNTATEFSGFESSICLTRFDRNVTAVVGNAYGLLQQYEELISIVQMIVVNSFVGKNVWIHDAAIQTNFTTEYTNRNNAWQTSKAGITAFIAALEQDLITYGNTLTTCFTGIQTGLVPEYARITAAVPVCLEFDS